MSDEPRGKAMVNDPVNSVGNLPALPDDPGQFILYQTEDGQTRVEVRFFRETVWLSLNQMAELFQRGKSVISRHIANVFEEGELDRGATVAEFAAVQNEGSRQVERHIEYYNLDVIISVGYRVKSHRGTQFRIWATQRLREYLIKGFALDEQRLEEAARYVSWEGTLSEPAAIRKSRITVSDRKRSERVGRWNSRRPPDLPSRIEESWRHEGLFLMLLQV